MTKHSITPPPAWLQKILYETPTCIEMVQLAYAAGADAELEACCEWLDQVAYATAGALRHVRRPKPPSLKEQALAILDDCSDSLDGSHENIIRQALEALPNDN